MTKPTNIDELKKMFKYDNMVPEQRARYAKMFKSVLSKGQKIEKPDWWDNYNEQDAMFELFKMYDNCFPSFYLRKTSDKVNKLFVKITESESERLKKIFSQQTYTILLSCQK